MYLILLSFGIRVSSKGIFAFADLVELSGCNN
jgi:hypothetical protein